ncbi:MAG: 3-deoxy-D-manno-octulosonate 8-phosphate phosphatase [Desulfobulbus propionicus]|nr:MAG: 3-deoxy-D-manno-octulosonate 8-phosphate phosphatase [Desulfobulbus propionicus]
MNRTLSVERSKAWRNALQYARKVKILVLDVDGVLTDGKLTFTSSGDELKSFNAQDGLGMSMLRQCGIEIGLITARISPVVARRAEELGLIHVYQGCKNKLTAYEALLKKSGLRPLQTACMGDDWIDLPLLNRAGFAVAPGNGTTELKQRAHYVTTRQGGNGAVREVCELIMDAQGQYTKMLRHFDR